MEKQQLRKELKSLRNQLSQGQVFDWSAKICEKLKQTSFYHQSDIIMSYLSFGNEPCLDSFLKQAMLEGKQIYVPEIVSKHEIVAVKLNDLQFLTNDSYGIRSVSGKKEYLEHKSLQLVLVPGVGFSTCGGRIGMGAGYYDRFLAKASNALRVGITYNTLLCEDIPMDEHDQVMQYVITETTVTQCE